MNAITIMVTCRSPRKMVPQLHTEQRCTRDLFIAINCLCCTLTPCHHQVNIASTGARSTPYQVLEKSRSSVKYSVLQKSRAHLPVRELKLESHNRSSNTLVNRLGNYNTIKKYCLMWEATPSNMLVGRMKNLKMMEDLTVKGRLLVS